MKNLKLVLAFVAAATLFTACKNADKEMADDRADFFTIYVDSVSNITAAESAQRWDDVEMGYEKAKIDAESSIANSTNKEEYQERLDNANMKYEDYKVEVTAEKDRMNRENATLNIRKTLLGDSYTGGDLTFDWVNKSNILSVYDNLVNTVEKNKDSYSREDWDEIKLIYEALDTRKNTVENEGLTSSDNLKIAGLKIKFAAISTTNRIGAKSEENADAKQ
jgi:hypothetical protein